MGIRDQHTGCQELELWVGGWPGLLCLCSLYKEEAKPSTVQQKLCPGTKII